MHAFDDLKAVFYTYITNPDDRKMVERAYLFAAEKHKDQKRKSGEPYIQHPLEVAYILAQLQGGPATIAAGFLHDVVEDTDTTIEDIKNLFGEDVAKIVDSLTKIQRLKLSKRTEVDFEAEDHRKIFLGMAQDVRVILVKLADRLHNMRTLQSLSVERQKALSKETLEVFTPIAHRLGIYTIQSELEDLCLKYLEPEKYRRILELVNERTQHRKESLESVKKRIADILLNSKIPFRMESRVKSIYSLYRKMYLKGHSIDDIFDILAIRIITETELNCYEILGIIHQTYKPIPGRFKDYIAMPKPNMYQSLHTSVVAGDGQTYEVQIRTEDMDKIAETGVAAHWKYKEGGHYNAKEEQKEIEEQLHWFRDFVNMSGQQDGTAREYMEALTNDVFGANVYVFTPLGKVIDLPTGSTPLDFAYKIHTKIGDSTVGAVVNGVGVPLNTVLKTGDICEIRTSKSAAGPNEGWLEIAKTNSAKAHIRKALQRRDADIMREERVRNGRASCIDAFRMQGIDEEEMDRLLNVPKVLNEYHCDSLDDLFVMMAAKNPTPGAVIDFLGVKRRRKSIDFTAFAKAKSQAQGNDKNPVEVAGGVTNLAIGFGQCCCPIPGDDIVGYITKGKGITIHRRNCPNVVNENKRIIDVRWKKNLGISSYPVDIEIYSNDRPNLLADVLSALSSKGVPVSDLKAHLITQTMNDVINLTIAVPDAKVLEDCFVLLLGVKGVYSVNRLIH
ncbi:MAG: bifunctional (p)ppGpp synthetase/guanosine-3',5'-bis(diphosphate) 3'-pyrophosphohydrolase [Bacilli bacterium]|nr:bifunctional (p)ppGpp synthetase/guanosine-3',5'-bis(diphosphate) 3'-pyrophosphohydrolase [Bacilli bacterium]